MINKKGQLRIQQMAFMIVAVVFFFVLVGLFFLGYQSKNITENFADLQKEQAIGSLKVIAGMTELNCDDSKELCLDNDKLLIMSKESKKYSDIWPVASVKVIKVYPAFEKRVNCPGIDCNYYNVYDSGQKNVKEYSTYVSICQKREDNSYIYDKCEVGKLILGVKLPVTK